MNSERLIGISDAFSALFTRFQGFIALFAPGGIHHLAHVLTVPPTKVCLLCATPAGMNLYIDIQLHAHRHLPSAVPWISEDHLLVNVRFIPR